MCQDVRDPAVIVGLYSLRMELKSWLQEAKLRSGMTLEQLGEVVGRSKANVGHWMKGLHEPSFQQVVAISKATGHPLPQELVSAGLDGLPDVAHDVSYQKVKTPPITPWEDVMNLEKLPVVPSDLMVEVPDDALAARGLSKGQHVWFKARTTAEPRNVVLIEANGRRYIRRYAEDAQGPFAQALDDAYPSFREFKVVAVMHMRPESSI